MKKLTSKAILFTLTLSLGFVLNINMSSAKEVHIEIENHRFTPDVVEINEGERVRLIIHNKDATPEEFESNDFHREKIISGNSKGIVLVGPLKAGEYKFFGEFHEDTAQGKLIVK